jgi:hypothetical protein
MGVRAALLLGVLLLLAAFVRGGLYAPGHDFVVNRFTGEFQFVPAEEDEGAAVPTRSASARCAALTLRRPKARVARLPVHGGWREISTGR